MRDRHALGLTGRPRGEEHVRQVVRVHGTHGRRERRGLAGQRIGRQHGHLRVGQPVRHRGVGHRVPRVGRAQQPGQIGGRMGGVERQVGGAGLEDAQQGGHQGQAAFLEDADQVVGADSGRAQVQRYPVGEGVDSA